MINCRSIGRDNYYEILSVDENASYEEIRTGYRNAILKSHPDKIQSTKLISSSDLMLKEAFHKIQKAWEILGCSSSRAVYDSELKSSRRDLIMADDVLMEDMIAQDDGEAVLFHYQCRCGDYFSTDSFELESVGCMVKRGKNDVSLQTSSGTDTYIVLPCPSCSLKIRLLVDSDSRLIIHD